MVLEANIRLYPSVQVTGQSFKKVKRCVVPNQSMSLREIIKRFIRRESLPVHQEGSYEERFGDLEKLSKADIVVQMEKVDELKSQLDGIRKREKARTDKAKADAAAAKNVEPPPPTGGVAPIKTPGTPSPT